MEFQSDHSLTYLDVQIIIEVPWDPGLPPKPGSCLSVKVSDNMNLTCDITASRGNNKWESQETMVRLLVIMKSSSDNLAKCRQGRVTDVTDATQVLDGTVCRIA